MDTATAVLAQKAYSGNVEPEPTTLSTIVGRNRYRGMEPAVKMTKVFLRPIMSDTAAHTRRPPVRQKEILQKCFMKSKIARNFVTNTRT